jgi:hypothetical protein
VVSEQVGPVRPSWSSHNYFNPLVCDKYVNTVDTCSNWLMVGISKVGETWVGEPNLEVREPNERILSGLFPLGNFRGRKFFKWGRVVTPRFLILVY